MSASSKRSNALYQLMTARPPESIRLKMSCHISRARLVRYGRLLSSHRRSPSTLTAFCTASPDQRVRSGRPFGLRLDYDACKRPTGTTFQQLTKLKTTE